MAQLDKQAARDKALRSVQEAVFTRLLPHYAARIQRCVNGMEGLLNLHPELITLPDRRTVFRDQQQVTAALIAQLLGRHYGRKSYTHMMSRFHQTIKNNFTIYRELLALQFQVVPDFSFVRDHSRHLRASEFACNDWFQRWMTLVRQPLG